MEKPKAALCCWVSSDPGRRLTGAVTLRQLQLSVPVQPPELLPQQLPSCQGSESRLGHQRALQCGAAPIQLSVCEAGWMDSWGRQSPQLLHPAPGPPGWVTPSSCQQSREASQMSRSAWKSVEQGGQDLRQELLLTHVSTAGKSKSCSKVVSSNIVLSSSVLKEETQAHVIYMIE